MKILVPIKRVPDAFAKVRLKADGSGIEETGLKFDINPFDEIAMEEAVRIKEKRGCEIIAVSIGASICEEQLRKALAMGADRGILIETEAKYDSFDIARTLFQVVQREKPDLVLMGKQAIDDDSNQVGQMLAAMLDYPQATFASEVVLENGTAKATRETDTGQEVLEFPLPAVITADLRLNEPRYVPLPGIIKARSKPIEKIPLSELGVEMRCSVRVIEMREAPPRKAGRKVENVDELLRLLREEAGVI
ncbi:MAG TPA: electron transfer flavoprotein subunit beta/FixA family protein [Fimbriimonadales bacterium]|nr:electron transfer flavoprotein subunit beta/FixA family protein [Fimbriimonadales bacterium]